MLSSTSRISGRARTVHVNSTTLNTRKVAGRRICLRFQSTTSGASSTTGSHVAAGIAGGTAVVLAGYAWYHFSGAKTAIDASKSVQQYYQQTKATVAEKAPKNANEAIEFLRKTANSYAGLIPGASSYIDSTFDTIDKLQQTHGEDVNKILQEGYDEVRKILQDDKGGVNVETGMKVMDVLRRKMSELEEVGKKAGQDAFDVISEKYPEVKEKLGGGYDDLRKMAEKNGPEAKKILDDTMKQVRDIFTKGFSPDSLHQAQELFQSKASEISNLAQSSSQDAWNKALKEAQPYLDKVPDVKKLLEENAGKLMAAGAAQGTVIKELLAKVKEAAEGDAAKNKEKMKELQEFVMKKVQEAQGQGSAGMEQGWKVAQEWIKSIPGGEEMLKQAPDVSALIQVAQDRSDEAKKLTQETYDEIVKVLEEKSKRAKELAKKTQAEAKKKSS